MTTATRGWHGKAVPVVPKHYQKVVARPLAPHGRVLVLMPDGVCAGELKGHVWSERQMATVYTVQLDRAPSDMAPVKLVKVLRGQIEPEN
jgi:hypothetical protein